MIHLFTSQMVLTLSGFFLNFFENIRSLNLCNKNHKNHNQFSAVFLTLFLHFNGHFPDGSGLASTRTSPFWILLELRMMEVVVTTGVLRCAKLQSNHHHQNTNTQSFYRPSCRPINSARALKEKSVFFTLAIPNVLLCEVISAKRPIKSKLKATVIVIFDHINDEATKRHITTPFSGLMMQQPLLLMPTLWVLPVIYGNANLA